MLIDYMLDRPWLAASFSAICLLDALNCVLNGHTDWWFPALLAFGFAARFRRIKPC